MQRTWHKTTKKGVVGSWKWNLHEWDIALIKGTPESSLALSPSLPCKDIRKYSITKEHPYQKQIMLAPWSLASSLELQDMFLLFIMHLVSHSCQQSKHTKTRRYTNFTYKIEKYTLCNTQCWLGWRDLQYSHKLQVGIYSLSFSLAICLLSLQMITSTDWLIQFAEIKPKE